MEKQGAQKPVWLKKSWLETDEMREVEALVRELGLNTVCREASCPNRSECFGRGVATFMILGANCTRSCGFCGVTCSTPEGVDPEEPLRVAEAVKRLGLGYIVVTSVTRDDLADGGAAQFAKTVREIRRLSPGTRIETLIPDFGGSEASLDLVIESAPDVISHNMETVRALYAKARPQADYDTSLGVLRRIAARGADGAGEAGYGNGVEASYGNGVETSYGNGGAADNARGGQDGGARAVRCKSGFMVGVGETNAQILELMDDLRAAGCTMLTIGQYLRPSPENIPVEEYIEPETFDRLAAEARSRGFEFVASAPFVRSSYHAEEAFA